MLEVASLAPSITANLTDQNKTHRVSGTQYTSIHNTHTDHTPDSGAYYGVRTKIGRKREGCVVVLGARGFAKPHHVILSHNSSFLIVLLTTYPSSH